MLPEVGGLEWLIIAVVALVVIGPKDLPVMMRKVGQFVAKLRGMANEFRASFDEMARQSELDELRKEVEAMRRGQFADMASHENEMRSTVSDIEQSLSDVGVQLHPPMSHQYGAAAQTEPENLPVQIAEAPPKAKPPRKPKAPAAPKATKAAAAKATAAAPKAKKAAAAAAPAAPKRKPRAKTVVEEGR